MRPEIAVFVTLLCAGLALVHYANQRGERRRVERLAQRRLRAAERELARVGKRALRPGYPFSILALLDQRLAQAGMTMSLWTFVGIALSLLIGVTALARTTLHLMVAVGIGLAAAGVPVLYLNFRARRRLKKIALQLPYVLDLLKSALESGHSLVRGLQIASINLPEPLASELALVIEQVRLGLALPMALDGLYRRIPIEEIDFLASAVRVQTQIGSGLAEIMGHVAHSVRTRQRLDEQLHALTTQSRTSAYVVSALPIVVLGAFELIRPGYTGVLFNNPLGIRLLELAILMDASAIILMRRIAQVDY